MTFTIKVPIAEADAVATLKPVLQAITMQNKACNVLIRSRIDGLGTPDAKVTLTFDDAACEMASPTG